MISTRGLVALLATLGLVLAAFGGPASAALSGTRWQLEAVWFLLVLTLVVPPVSNLLENSWDYVLGLGVVGGPLALATLYQQILAPAHIRCPHCIAEHGAAAAITVLALCSPARATPFWSRLRKDSKQIRTTWAVIILTAIAAVSWTGIALAHTARLHKWLSGSERVAALDATDQSVRVTVFSDFQCPACAAKHQSYDSVLDDLAESSAGKIVVDRLDFPLDSECNPRVSAVVHPAACEAAVLYRIARKAGLAKRVATYLYQHHRDLTADSVRAYANELGLAGEYESRYSEVAELIRKDIQTGALAGITGTPTYFVNGIRIDNAMSPTMLAAIVKAAARQ